MVLQYNPIHRYNVCLNKFIYLLDSSDYTAEVPNQGVTNLNLGRRKIISNIKQSNHTYFSQFKKNDFMKDTVFVFNVITQVI